MIKIRVTFMNQLRSSFGAIEDWNTSIYNDDRMVQYCDRLSGRSRIGTINQAMLLE